MSAAYLAKLNPEQRRAVEHGVQTRGTAALPLLVIAGAGSGKTNTLAHRVAHLIVEGADPRRIMLLTFSRRAAAEMARRVERISSQVIGHNAGIMTDALTWAGTFHGIGARLLREYADQIGIAGFLDAHEIPDDVAEFSHFIPTRLTWSGYEFLDVVRAPEVWRRTKAGVTKAGGASMEFMWELAKAYGKQLIKEKIGIDL